MFANFLSEKEITVKQPPFDFAALPRANEDHIRAALSDLREFLEEEEDRLDAEYLEFVQTIGAGTLGRAKMYVERKYFVSVVAIDWVIAIGWLAFRQRHRFRIRPTSDFTRCC